MSQILEKIDHVIEKTFFNELSKTLPNNQTLITIISFASEGLLAVSEKEHKSRYDKEVVNEIPVSTDFTKFYENISLINWFTE